MLCDHSAEAIVTGLGEGAAASFQAHGIATERAVEDADGDAIRSDAT